MEAVPMTLSKTEQAILTRMRQGYKKADIKRGLMLSRAKFNAAIESLMDKGLIREVKPGKYETKQAKPITLGTSWSNPAPLKMHTETDMNIWNYHDLPKDDPERIRIESLFRVTKGGKGA